MITVKNFVEMLMDFFIMIHVSGFEMIREFPKTLQSYGFVMAMTTLISAIILLLLVLCLDVMVFCGILWLILGILIRIQTKKIERNPVVGTVTSKEYKKGSSSCTFNATLGMTTMDSTSEKYKVHVKYNELTETFYNKELFKKYKENDAISLMLVQKLDKDNKVIEQKLELTE